MTPQRWPSATTGRVVLLGDPVDHSLSPMLHNTAFRQLDLDLVYVALRVDAGDVRTVLDGLGASGCVGANVTVPHKLAAHDACDERTDVARATGAVNTLWWRDGRLHGDNTDVTGFGRVLADTGSTGPAVVLGTGGAARAVVVALHDTGVETVVVGRRVEAAEHVAALSTLARAVDLADDRAVSDCLATARTVVNTTPLGMHGERLPAPFHRLTEQHTAHDLVYVAGATPWLADAATAGAHVVDGRALLAAQAEDAFRRWTVTDPPAGLFTALLARDDRSGDGRSS